MSGAVLLEITSKGKPIDTLESAGISISNVVGIMVRATVDSPDDVLIEINLLGTNTVVALITVAATDLGKVIGKQGRTARSLRSLASAAGQKLGVVVQLDIRKFSVPTA